MKTKSIVALFVALSIILAIQPRMIYDLYNTLLGRLVIIVVIVFFAMHNVTLGLLVVLALIIVSNKFTTFTEGLETMDKTTTTLGTVPSTIGDDNATTGSSADKQTVLTRTATVSLNDKDKSGNPTISELKTQAETKGVDKETIKTTIASKPSNSLPVASTSSSENVQPFTSGMMNNKASLTEGFCPCAASVF
jgi:hypothetical protein